MTSERLKIVDLFAGIGGLRQGVQQAIKTQKRDYDIVFTSEIKKPAIETLKANWPAEEIHGDITKIDEKSIPAHDILLAGFPCQPFSFAGARRGFADTRGTLFYDVLRILKHHKPKYFILENVEGLIRHDMDPEDKTAKIGRTLTTILKELVDLGYNIDWSLLDAKDFSVPQARKRIFIAGRLDGVVDLSKVKKSAPKKLKDIIDKSAPILLTAKEESFQKQLLKYYQANDLIGKRINNKRGGSLNVHSWDFAHHGQISNDEKDLLNSLLLERRKKSWAAKKNIKWRDGISLTESEISTFYKGAIDLGTALKNLLSLGYLKINNLNEYDVAGGKLSFPYSNILDPEGISPTVVATDANRMAVAVDGKLRRLSHKEFKRLFGFDDNFILPDSLNDNAFFDLFGNSVVIPVAKAVALEVL